MMRDLRSEKEMRNVRCNMGDGRSYIRNKRCKMAVWGSEIRDVYEV